jgi:hypothetical protein
LTDWAGISVNRGKTVEAGPEGIFDVAVEFRSEPAIRRLLEISVEYVESLVAGRTRWMSESRRSRTLWLGTNWGRAPVHNMKVDVLSRGDRFEIEKRVAVRQ